MKNTRRMALVLFGVVGASFVGMGSAAAQNQGIPDGWFKTRAKQGDVDITSVQYMARADNGQLLTSVVFLEFTGKVNRKVLQVVVPTSRLVSAGVGLQIDNGNTQKVDYAVCFPDRCLAEVQLTDQLVASFKKGSSVTLTSVNFQQQPNPIKITLAGFTSAFDGEPLRQDDLNQRQQQLEEFVRKNDDAYAERLRQAQEKEKAKLDAN